MNRTSITVSATWDEDAKVWVAESSDIDGLATEADTLDELREKILVMISELLELDDDRSDLAQIPVRITAEQRTLVNNPRF